MPEGDLVQVPGAELARPCTRSCAAASTDDNRPIITGVLLSAEDDGLRLVATDSYRLAVRDLPGSRCWATGPRCSVPSRALKEVERRSAGAETITVRFGERDAAFEVGTTRTSPPD